MLFRLHDGIKAFNQGRKHFGQIQMMSLDTVMGSRCFPGTLGRLDGHISQINQRDGDIVLLIRPDTGQPNASGQHTIGTVETLYRVFRVFPYRDILLEDLTSNLK